MQLVGFGVYLKYRNLLLCRSEYKPYYSMYRNYKPCYRMYRNYKPYYRMCRNYKPYYRMYRNPTKQLVLNSRTAPPWLTGHRCEVRWRSAAASRCLSGTPKCCPRLPAEAEIIMRFSRFPSSFYRILSVSSPNTATSSTACGRQSFQTALLSYPALLSLLGSQCGHRTAKTIRCPPAAMPFVSQILATLRSLLVRSQFGSLSLHS